MVIALLLSRLVGAQGDGRWLYLTRTQAGDRLFYDRKTLKNDGRRVEVWVRRFSPESASPAQTIRLDPQTQKALDEAFKDTVAPADTSYPLGKEPSREFLWVIFADRTVKEYSGNVWSQREPVRPETVPEYLWECFFVRKKLPR